MPEDRILFPVLSVDVAALLCSCGACGHSFLVEHEALDLENGVIDSAYAFGDCPECGEAFNAEAARFSASLTSSAAKETETMLDLPNLREERTDDWVAACGLCSAHFAVTAKDSPQNPGPHGTFCPDCRDRKHPAPGVLNWRRRNQSN
jgi:hypothetical protein